MHGSWAITGAGLVSAAGDTTNALLASLVDARPLASSENDLAAPPAAPIPAVPIRSFEASAYVKRKGFKLLSRTSQLACAAASRLHGTLVDVAPAATGVVLGTGWASTDSVVRFEREAHTEGPRFVDPVLFTETVANVPAGHLSILNGWSACNATIAAGSVSGTDALLRAVALLEEERAGLIVAGGVDELNAHLLRALRADGRTSGSAASLPFATDRSGPVGGEAACLFAIEDEPSAASRGARVLGRLCGGASRTIEAGRDDDLPSRVGLIRQVLADGGVDPGAIDLVVLSGNGDPEGDSREAAAVVEVFGAAMPPAVAPKAVLGETWGAAGALGVAVALESMAQRLVPPAPAATAAGARALGLRLPTAAEPRDVARTLVLDGAGSPRFSALVLTE